MRVCGCCGAGVWVQASFRSIPVTDRTRLESLAAIRVGRTPKSSPAMTNNEKPQVDVPVGSAPSYQLELEDIAVGDGDEATAGNIVEVHYVGVSWKTGQQFDASWDRGDTFKFTLGKGQVIRGWDEGVAGMKVGGRRRSTIPPHPPHRPRRAGGGVGPRRAPRFLVGPVSA